MQAVGRACLVAAMAVAVLLLSALGIPLARGQERQHAVLLVATAQLTDPNFAESVVLVTMRPSGGAVGVILNRPTDTRASDVLPAHEGLKTRTDVVFRGGPVSRGALVLAFRTADRLPPGNTARVLDDVYLSLDPDVIDRVLGQPDPPTFRLYTGYAGWAPGQLEAEMLRGGWFVVEADAESVFTTNPRDLWRTLMLRASSRRQSAAVRLPAAPPPAPS